MTKRIIFDISWSLDGEHEVYCSNKRIQSAVRRALKRTKAESKVNALEGLIKTLDIRLKNENINKVSVETAFKFLRLQLIKEHQKELQNACKI